MTAQYGFYIDVDRCTACKTCIAACKDKNDTFVGLKYRRVIDCEGGSWTQSEGVQVPDGVFVYSVSYSCNHCAMPACLAACPTNAISKRDDGIVVIDKDNCIGCGSCKAACPYDTPRLNTEAQVMGKCDFCVDRLERGENPACVDACLMRCIEHGELADLQAKYGSQADLEPLASSGTTTPSLVIGLPRTNPGNAPVRVVSPPEELL
ncbi:MAG: 4Fe-4S dicluster domain-containing protein [Coriobacteriales bacterium]|jgi:anaerobic dimethyl sulfoxide reductase subunit B (iron-sulfur subunit)|nr:4Fe-4S dicluster domain-containing protein [Coriobacteriales bacterium]